MISKSEISFVKALHQKKYREQQGLFIVEGIKMVEELLQSSLSVHSIYSLADKSSNWFQISVKDTEKIKFNTVNQVELNKISLQQNPNQVLAVARTPHFEYSTKKKTEYFSEDLLLALDNVQDPGNMGSVIRIADWFGIHTVVASPNSVEFFNPKVVQASMGSVFRLKLINMDLTKFLQDSPRPVFGALLAGKSVYHENYSEGAVVVMGNESKGISEELKKYIQHPITIPGYGAAESLNVAVATAVICSEIRRK